MLIFSVSVCPWVHESYDANLKSQLTFMLLYVVFFQEYYATSTKNVLHRLIEYMQAHIL